MKLFERNICKIHKDSIIITLIILLPFVFFVYNFVPDTKTWNNTFFEIDAGAFEDVSYFLWYLSVKLLTGFILTFWYLSCTNRWRSILFIPIISEIWKFLNIINASKFGMLSESVSITETLYYSVPYIILLLIISKKLNYYKQYNTDVAPLNNEIIHQVLKLSKTKKNLYKSVKAEIKVLNIQKQNMDKKEYLARLISLRDQLSITD